MTCVSVRVWSVERLHCVHAAKVLAARPCCAKSVKKLLHIFDIVIDLYTTHHMPENEI